MIIPTRRGQRNSSATNLFPSKYLTNIDEEASKSGHVTSPRKLIGGSDIHFSAKQSGKVLLARARLSKADKRFTMMNIGLVRWIKLLVSGLSKMSCKMDEPVARSDCAQPRNDYIITCCIT